MHAGDGLPNCIVLYVYLSPEPVRLRRHKLVFMGNDDVETPTALVGKKIAPIWVDQDGAMAESLDIIAKNDPEVGHIRLG
jgi:glutaredoxin 2